MSIREISGILDLLREAPGPCALATLVRVEGSSYRRVGARLLLTADGRRAGSISGGCLEDDVRERAQAVLSSGVAQTAVYDTTGENDLVWGVGLGCHGVATVFVERLAGVPGWAKALSGNLEATRSTPLAVVWGPRNGDTPGTRLADPSHPPEGPDVFLETIEPPVTLAICGAGDDALPLAALATGMGWRVVVGDPRPAYPTRERFPEARDWLTGPPEEIARRLPDSPLSAAVVMTHHYVYDVPFLRELLPRPLAYLGLLGPRPRAEKILRDLQDDGLAVTSEMRARLRAPVGLDLGADNPEEVALSIVAEIRTVLTGRDGRPLRERTLPIHG